MRKRGIGALVVLALLLVPGTAQQQDKQLRLLGSSWREGEESVLYDIDVNTGIASSPRNTVKHLTGLAFDRGGRLYGLTTYDSTAPNSLVRIDPNDGAITVIGATGLASMYEGDLAFDPVSGQLYALYDTHPAQTLFTVDLTSGRATPVGTFSGVAVADISAMGFDQAGQLFAIETEHDLVLRIDKTNATILSSVPLSHPLGYTAGLAYHPEQERWYVADGNQDGTNTLYTIDLGTGRMTIVGGTQIATGISGLVFRPR
jgi:DNA-binding beta-propeller fold protein YncE